MLTCYRMKLAIFPVIVCAKGNLQFNGFDISLPEAISISPWYGTGLLIVLLILMFLAQYYDETRLEMVIQTCLIPGHFRISVYMVVQPSGFIRRAMETRPAQFLGKISYSVYLNHALA